MLVQVPESPGLLSPGLKVSSLSVISGGGELERGRVRDLSEEGPPSILEPFGHQNGVKRASTNLSKNRCPKKRPWGAPGTPQGAPRGAQEAKWEPKGSQNAPKRAPKIDDFRVRARN